MIRFAYIISVLVILLTVGEIIARHFDAPQPYSALFSYDDTLGFTTPRSRDVVFNVDRKIYKLSFNNEGHSDYFYERKPDVLMLGDGLIAGIELPRSQRLAVRLSKATKRGVLNLAVTGYGICQQYLQIDQYLKNHSSPENLVLVMNLPSDIFDSELNSSVRMNKPVFIEEGDQWTLIAPNRQGFFYKFSARIWKNSRLIGGLLSIWNKNKKHRHIVGEPIINSQMIDSTKYCLDKLRQIAELYKINLLIVVWTEGHSDDSNRFVGMVSEKMPSLNILHVTASEICKRSDCYVKHTKHFNRQSIQSLVNLLIPLL